MPKQNNIFDKHPFCFSWTSIEKLIDRDGFIDDELEESLFLEILSLQRAIFYIRNIIDQDCKAFSPKVLGAMSLHNIDCIHELFLFQQSRNINHIKKANEYMNSNVDIVKQISPGRRSC